MSLSSPAAVQARLNEIEADLAAKQNELEAVAVDWFRAKRDREKRHAEAFMVHGGTVAERKAQADLAVEAVGVEEEGTFEGLKAVVRVLDTRAAIGMALLKAQGRGA